MSTHEQDPMIADVEHLVGAAEIARLLSVSRQRVDQLTRRPGFPAPTATLKMGKVWITDEVLAWAAGDGREVTEDES